MPAPIASRVVPCPACARPVVIPPQLEGGVIACGACKKPFPSPAFTAPPPALAAPAAVPLSESRRRRAVAFFRRHRLNLAAVAAICSFLVGGCAVDAFWPASASRSVGQLYSDYLSNRESADRRYTGRIVEVSGLAGQAIEGKLVWYGRSSFRPRYGVMTAEQYEDQLQAAASAEMLPGVVADLRIGQAFQLWRTRPDRHVTVRGRCRGMSGGVVYLSGCYIVDMSP